MTASRYITFCLLAPSSVLLVSFSLLSNAQWFDHYSSTANVSTSYGRYSAQFSYWKTGRMMPILVSGSFVCGFYCDVAGEACLFSVSTFPTSLHGNTSGFTPKMIWSANRNNPVNLEGSLQFTQDGDLLLKDEHGGLLWSTATGGQSVLGLNLTEEGNLVLYRRNNTLAWQSFDHPTDCLVPGQRLLSGQSLISASASNWSEGLYSFALENNGLVAYMNLDRPLVYYRSKEEFQLQTPYAEYKAGNFGPFELPVASSAQFIHLGRDGHLRAYEWRQSNLIEVSDFFTEQIGPCGYPLACGNYGICLNGHCTCPESAGNKTGNFRQIDNQPHHGCTANTPISCKLSQDHTFLEFQDLDYIAFELGSQINGTDAEGCKQFCLKNCSCKAATFRYRNVDSTGSCSLQSEVMSFRNRSTTQLQDSVVISYNYNVSTFIKVQNFPKAQGPPMANAPKPKGVILGSTLGSAFALFLIITMFFTMRNRKESEETEEEYLDMMSEMPSRFCYDELKAITDNFSNLLGKGGFGSVFEGTLPNGTKVAVKCLNGSGQVKKSFLAEVLTIGSIHHVNLVRLIGFCAQKNHRFLVYEYMCEGSLDKWIFQRKPQISLGWRTRKKIIHDIAKGLAYLHQECRQKIFHLDVKPQNILLDENFNAKVSDFGLAKLIDKDLSEVVTTMRGTPGYMAPEWLSSVITEKVDVYSFGVVVMEILCGRKNVDRSQPEEKMHLLTLLKKKAEEGELLDLVDKKSQDMQMNGAEVVEMMKVAVWCLQGDYAKRPSMSVVVKALEGSLPVEENLENVFWAPPEHKPLGIQADGEALGTVILHSALSGPR